MDEKQLPTGFQVSFLILALLLLAAPADKYLFSEWTWAREQGLPVARLGIFAVAAMVLFGIPRIRRACVHLLSIAVPRGRKSEIAAVTALNICAGFGAVGAVMLLVWMSGGEPGLARRVGEEVKAPELMSRAVSLGGIVFIVLASLVAPVLEELVFRGFLYKAWERQWGWIPSAFATSFFFGVIHPNQYAQFFSSLMYIALFRRTGSLWAPIIVHGLYNMSMWYPFVGQFVFPDAARGTGEITYWSFNILCLGVVIVVLPVYLWMSRDEKTPGAVAGAKLAR